MKKPAKSSLKKEEMATITQVIKKKRCFKMGIDSYNDIDGTLSEIIVSKIKITLYLYYN